MSYDAQLTNASDDELLQAVYMDANASPRERALAERFDAKADDLAYERQRNEDLKGEYETERAETQEMLAMLEQQIAKARAQLNDVRYTLA